MFWQTRQKSIKIDKKKLREPNQGDPLKFLGFLCLTVLNVVWGNTAKEYCLPPNPNLLAFSTQHGYLKKVLCCMNLPYFLLNWITSWANFAFLTTQDTCLCSTWTTRGVLNVSPANQAEIDLWRPPSSICIVEAQFCFEVNWCKKVDH